MKENCKNVTISVPEPLLDQFRVYAAIHKKSMTGLITEFMQNAVHGDEERERAKRSLLARLKKPPNLGTHGKITWTRDEIHER